MNMMSEAVIHPRTGQALMRVTMKGKNGRETRRTVSLEDYVQLITDSIKLERVSDGVVVKGSQIAKGYIEGIFDSNGSYTQVFRVAGTLRQLVLDNVGHFYVPFPDLIFVLKYDAEKNFFLQTKVFAVVEDQLFYYPFANVSREGNICLGSVKPGTSPDQFVEDFFLGITNHDYYDGWDAKHIKMQWSQEKLARELEKHDVFPTEWLVPIGMNVQELVDNVVNANMKKEVY